LRREAANVDDLGAPVEDMAAVLRFYERVLSERGIRRPS
jgi:hypothetical protein